MNIVKFIGSIVCVFLFLQANAFAGSWTGKKPLTLLYLHNSYDGVFIKTASISNPEECERSDMYFLPNTLKHYDHVYSLLLSAKVSGAEVNFYLVGCAGGNRPKIVHVRL